MIEPPMTAHIIDGKAVATRLRDDIKTRVEQRIAEGKSTPGLAVILVGSDPASQVYVGQKEKTSLALGVYSERHDLPADTIEEELLALIDKLNKDQKIHGILVQLPLPKHINETRVLFTIDP